MASTLRNVFLSRKDVVKNLLIVAILLSAVYLIILYNDAGKMRDAGVYVDSGFAVFKGENPYVCCSRWGSFGPVPFSALMAIVPLDVRAGTVRILSLAGIYCFYRVIFPNKETWEKLLVFFIILWTSPVRELLVTNQMTGVAVGLIGLGIKLSERYRVGKILTFAKLLSAIPIAMALDMKPHVTIVFFVSWVIYAKRLDVFFSTVIVMFTTHAIINFSQGRILELDWSSKIRNLNSLASENNLGDTLAFWPVLNNYIKAPDFFHALSIILSLNLTIVCFYLAKNQKKDSAIFLSFFVPATSIYYHFYDAVPLTVIVVILIVRMKNTFISALVLSFFLVPLIFESVRNQALIFAIGFLKIFWIHERVSDKPYAVLFGGLISGFAAAVVVHILNLRLDLSEHLLQSLIVTQCLVLALVIFFFSKKEKIHVTQP
jgi:hypothetical protein